MTPPIPYVPRPKLSVGRQARLELEIWKTIDARDDGDPVAYRAQIERLVEMNVRLRAEQIAELGELPQTIEGALAVLDCATRIVAAAAQNGVMRV